MYAMINREAMTFAHKHKNYQVLCNLAWIECASAHIFPLDDATKFKEFTDMELSLLYENTVQKKPSSLSRQQLQQVLFDLITSMDPSDVNAVEVESQADKVNDNLSGRMLYVKGSSVPVKQKKDELFQMQTEANAESESSARAGRLPALVRKVQPVQPRPVVATVAPERAAAAPRGTNKPLIWKTADRIWEEHGMPTDLKVVLQLRKLMMDDLEANGVKRASASSELGNWMKTKPVK